MILKRRHTRTFLIHFTIWALLYGFFLFPFFFQLRQIPPDLPIRLAITVILFYTNYYLLVPKILLSKRTLLYIVICTLLIFLSGALINLGFSPEPPKDLPRIHPRDDGPFGGRFIKQFFTILNLSTPIFVSALLKVYVEWKKNEDQRKIVEKEKVSSELQFLKTQLNPHFLFNSLNAIYSLSVKKSNHVSEAIISLSELMRYMLYEADKDKVQLAKELEYIKNYVQLQRLRLSDSANVKLKISGEDKGIEIPPLLFISFIENAFKYGTDYEGKTYVNINLSMEGDKLQLLVENKIGAFRKQHENSGVGLENIKNRLNLLFPHSHELKITDDGETFLVNLTLRIQQQQT